MKTKIKISAIVISLLTVMAFIFPVTMVGAADKLEISTSIAEGGVGDTVDIVFTVDKNPGFAALLINIPTTAGFEVVEVKNGTVMRQITVGKNILWDSTSNSTATGTLLTVTIRITDVAKAGENKINVRMIECFNADFNAVSVTIKPIVINVIGEAVPDDPIVSDTPTESVPEEDFTEEPGNNNPGEEESSTEVPGTEEPGTETSGTETPGTNVPVESEVDPGTDNVEPEESETTTENIGGAEQSKGGCFSFAGGFAVMIAVLPVAAILLTKKRK